MNEKLQLQSVRTWFDPMDMFRQIAPDGIVDKDAVDKSVPPGDALDNDTKIEIDQTPRLTEGDSISGVEAQKLMEAAGCPFAGHDRKEAMAPYEPTVATASIPSGDSGEQNKLDHPNAPLSDQTVEMLRSGKQEDADQDPYI